VPEQPAVDLDQVARDIDACSDSQLRLVEHLHSLDGVDPAQPSLLPGWSVGHVLTHIARNADSMLRMLSGLPQYWLGAESRNADIELGAGREWAMLVDDVVTTGDAVSRRMHEVADWAGTVAGSTAERPKAMVPALRRREVEIHRSDLDLGYTFADMPSDYVRSDTRVMEMLWKARQPMGLTPLPEAVATSPDHLRLAWLFGRTAVAGVAPAAIY
jgi:maleylpyruvate isomerase